MLGYTLPEALGNLARRVEVPQVSMFAAAVSLAAEQGSSIGAVIESQAESARGAYFKELEEKANKLPTKMIVPMIFLILPSLSSHVHPARAHPDRHPLTCDEKGGT